MKIYFKPWAHFAAILVLASLSSLSLAGGFDVGNGGDGVTRDGKLYLRDFAEVGLKAEPIISQWYDPEMNRAVQDLKAIGGIEWNQRLLVQKLTDINYVSPGLGFILVEVLKQYRITGATEPLTLIPDASWNDGLDPRLQIAVRLGDQIRVSNENWNRLDDINQIGLLIHEAIYSLSTPLCKYGSRSTCTPSKQNVRSLTARLMTSVPKTANDIDPMLALLSIKPIRRDFCAQSVIHGFLMAKYDGNENTPSAFKEFEFGESDSIFKVRSMINDECNQQFRDHPDSHDLVLTMGLRYLTITKSEYFDEFGFQMNTSVVEKINYVTRGEDVRTAFGCRNMVIVDFFAAVSWFAAESPLGPNKICNSAAF